MCCKNNDNKCCLSCIKLTSDILQLYIDYLNLKLKSKYFDKFCQMFLKSLPSVSFYSYIRGSTLRPEDIIENINNDPVGVCPIVRLDIFFQRTATSARELRLRSMRVLPRVEAKGPPRPLAAIGL